MGTKTIISVLIGIVATLAVAIPSFAQIKVNPELRRTDPNLEPVWTIEHLNGAIYRAMSNNSGTAFLVTDDGIVLADPINPEFAAWLNHLY